MKRFVLPGLIVILVIVEIVLALSGPMAFVQKPSIVVSLPFAYGMDPADVQAIFDRVQRSFARTRVFRVVSHELVENYYFEKEDRPDFSIDATMTYPDYQKMAEDLGIERLAMVMVFPGADSLEVSITLRNVATGDVMDRFKYACTDVDAFLRGVTLDEDRFDLTRDLREVTRGVALFDYLVFILLAGQAMLAVLLIFGKRPDLTNQILLVAGLLLFLFAFVYAKNASMDYVQRFIANKGQISLAESTATEQLYAAIRFGPLLLFNIFIFVRDRVLRARLASERELAGPLQPGAAPDGALAKAVRTWALPMVLLGSLLYSLSFPSFASLAGLPFFAWICLVPLFLAIIFSGIRTGIFSVVVYGALTTLVLNYWHGTYSYISLAFSVILSSVFYVLLAPVLVVTIKRTGKWGFLVATALWVAFEYVRSIGYIGYPWGYLGVSQYSFVPLIQVSDLGGIWAVTLLVVLWNAGLTWSIASLNRPWGWPSSARAVRPRRGAARLLDRGRWVPAAAATVAVAVALIYGGFRMIPRLPENADTLRVALIQQNTDPRKHDYRLSFETLVEQTNAALAQCAPRVPDLIVWPEGSFKPDVRYWLEHPNARGNSPELVVELFEYAPTLGTYLVTGTQDHVYLTEDGEEVRRNFNSSMLLSDTGQIIDFYHKIRLVPFTEHFPYKKQFPWLADLLDKFDTSNWKAGEERTIFELPRAGFFTPICFEDIFPGEVRQFVLRGADLIANISNDYWSLTPVEGMQHAVHAVFRAVENRRPMVRATSSGLTTYITTEGRMAKDHPAFYTPAHMIVDIPIFQRPATLYTRAGDWLPLVCLATGLAAFLLAVGLSIRHSVLHRRDRQRPHPDSPEIAPDA